MLTLFLDNSVNHRALAFIARLKSDEINLAPLHQLPQPSTEPVLRSPTCEISDFWPVLMLLEERFLYPNLYPVETDKKHLTRCLLNKLLTEPTFNNYLQLFSNSTSRYLISSSITVIDTLMFSWVLNNNTPIAFPLHIKQFLSTMAANTIIHGTMNAQEINTYETITGHYNHTGAIAGSCY